MSEGSLRAAVAGLVARFAPGRPDPTTFAGEARLARDLGFDSVRILELLIACEETFAVALPIEQILDGPPLTVIGVGQHVATHLGAVAP